MNELEQKQKFALHWLSDPNNPFKAAQAVFGVGNVGACLKVSQEWPVDAEVLAIRDALVAEHGERAFLPTREAAAREVYETAQRAKAAGELKEFREHMKLYADMMGFIEKSGTNVNVNNNVTIPRVMLKPEIKDWEKEAASNQLALSSDNVTTH